MNELFPVALSSIPLACFVAAAIVEFRRDRNSLRSPKRILPLALGVVCSILFVIPVELYYPNSWPDIAPPLSVVSLLIAASAFLCGYNSRLSSVITCVGGALLALLWYANRLVA